MGTAIHNVASAYNGYLPPVFGTLPPTSIPSATSFQLGWFTHILPYIEQQNIYKACFNAAGTAVNDPVTGSGLANVPIKTYIAPADVANATTKQNTSYAVNGGGQAPALGAIAASPAFDPLFGIPASTTVAVTTPTNLSNTFSFKGTSNTVATFEYGSTTAGRWWINAIPANTLWSPCTSTVTFTVPVVPQNSLGTVLVNGNGAASPGSATAFSTGAAQAGLCDGTVRSISQTIALNTWKWACDPSALAPPPVDW